MNLCQQVILITGASAGIGAALAENLAQQFPGIPLVLAARNLEKLNQIALSCRQRGAEVLVVPTDLSDVQQTQALASQAIEAFARVDILVNNAGYGQMGPIELVPPEAAKEQFAVNFHGALVLSQSLIPVMRNQGGGRIINISSLGGRMAFPTGGLYSASKFALEALSDVLRMELQGFGIQVSVIEAGPVMTEFFTVVRQKIDQHLIEPEKTAYRPVFGKLKALEAQIVGLAWSSERMASFIVKVLEKKRLRPRYVAATGGKMLIFLMTKVLPTWATDAFWQRFYGINLVIDTPHT